jgi:hypothetical protein
MRKYISNKTRKNKFNNEYCDEKMTFQECELSILRHAVDASEEKKGQKIASSDEIKKIINILEKFLIKKKLVCYGGTAINNILPKYAQFYNKDIEIPDYDFFSPNALNDAKELADIYHAEGYTEVEAKSGVHFGTYKVYVNFIPIADITYLYEPLFKSISKEAITVAGIKYAPPNFLRMSIYLELSRPEGDVSRWEKIFKRLILLNKYYPFDNKENCRDIDFQRELQENSKLSEKMYYVIRDSFIEQGCVFFGGYASSLYAKYMPKEQQSFFKKNPDFDVLSEDPERSSLIVREQLIENGFKNVNEIIHEPIGELIPEHIEICVGKDTVAFIYRPIACHNYNTIHIENKEINIATIDTMLSFYLAFIYADEYSLFKERILCMAKLLFDIEEKNRLEQRGILKRYTMNCIGKQPTLEEIRSEKNNKFNELKKGTKEYEMWFLNYNPSKKRKQAKKNVDEIEKEEPEKQPEREEEEVYSVKNKNNKTRKNRRIEKGYLY